MEVELTRLRAELSAVKDALTAREQDLLLSASLGQSLLEQNQQLNDKYDTALRQYSATIEGLEQECYRLRHDIKNEAGEKEAIQAMESENVLLKEQADSLQARLTQTEHDTGRLVKQLTRDLEQHKDELESVNLKLSQASKKCTQQDDIIRELQEQAKSKARVDALGEELSTYRSRLAETEATITQLQLERCDRQSEIERLKQENQAYVRRLDTANAEQSELEQRLTSVKQTLEADRNTIQELQAELAQYKDTNGNMGAGLDLFSEVEAKRIALEEGLISMRSKYGLLQKKLEMAEHDRRQLRQRVQTLMQMHGSRADEAKMRRLEEDLSQKSSEIEQLHRKLDHLEKQRREQARQMEERYAAFSDFGNQKAYVDYLQQELQDARQEHDRLKEEIRTKVMQQINDGNRQREIETRLHRAERDLEARQNEIMQLRLALNEAKALETTAQVIEAASPSVCRNCRQSQQSGKEAPKTAKPAAAPSTVKAAHPPPPPSVLANAMSGRSAFKPTSAFKPPPQAAPTSSAAEKAHSLQQQIEEAAEDEDGRESSRLPPKSTVVKPAPVKKIVIRQQDAATAGQSECNPQ